MTRLLVIGLDGVGMEAIRDYEIVELKQKKFGTVTSEGIDLKTPPIWSSFLCSAEDTGIHDFPDEETRMGGAGKHGESLFEELENSDPDDPHCSGGIGNRRDELTVDPWIEKYNFETVNFPVYDYSNYFDGIGDYQLYWGGKTLDGTISPKELVEKFSRESGSIIKRAYQKIDEENDIVLSYIHDTDYICHITYMHHGMKRPVLSYWTIVSNQIRQLKNKLDDETLVLLLSDHGSNIGKRIEGTPTREGHTPLGFYSFNKDIKVPESIHITKFQEIIGEELE